MSFSHRETLEGILLTDQYQLTMGSSLPNGPSRINCPVRSLLPTLPRLRQCHQAYYCINAGMEWLVDATRPFPPK